MTVQAVVFDVGETLVDETRTWSAWADWLGVPRLTFLSALGAEIARGGDGRDLFDLFRPGIDLDLETARRTAAGDSEAVLEIDLYPDVRPCMAALIARGYRLGVVGNQPVRTEQLFNALDISFELVASSDGWGLAKPDPRFFERIAAEFDLPPDRIAYVGDRIDNDVRPAAAAGMCAVFIRRGPWGWILGGREDPPEAALTIESLTELPDALAKVPASPRSTIFQLD